jgi:hypothetical protein
MDSPFPGIDPYLEPHWLDVHSKLATYGADELNRVLPQSLVARVEERVAIETDWEVARLVGPDVRVFSPAASDAAPPGAVAAVADAPFKLVVDLDPIIQRHIRIIDESGRLVSVIEFISPTNKVGEGLDAYRRKRDELLEGGVNLVEVDLVRHGDWRSLLRPHVCPAEAVSTYRTTVRLPPGRTVFLYPATLRAPLADVPVPLRADDPRVVIPLQRLIRSVYANGRYALTLDYRRPCDPALEPGDAAWSDDLLRAAGRR